MDQDQYDRDAAGQSIDDLRTVYDQNHWVITWIRDYAKEGFGEPRFHLGEISTAQVMSAEGRAAIEKWLRQYRRTFKALDAYPPGGGNYSLEELRYMVPSIRRVLDAIEDRLVIIKIDGNKSSIDDIDIGDGPWVTGETGSSNN